MMKKKMTLNIDKNMNHITDLYIRLLPQITKLSIHRNVVKIDHRAFYQQKSLRKVYFDAECKLSVLSIGIFQDCSALEVVKLPKGLVTIEDFAFKNCISIKELWLPDSIYQVGADAFAGWKENQTIYSPIKLKKPITCQANIVFTGIEAGPDKPKVVRNKDGENYYLVTVKCGHVKRHSFMPITFAIKAKDKKEAAAIARDTPRVKHHHKDFLLEIKLTDKEGYQKQLEVNSNDKYLKLKSKREQDKVFFEISDRIVAEPNYIKKKK